MNGMMISNSLQVSKGIFKIKTQNERGVRHES